MDGKFRIAVIGLGGWARRAYLPNLERMADVEIAALSSRSEENLNAACCLLRGQPRLYREYRQMLAAGGLDGVIVSTSGPSHPEVAAAVLDAGCPVLCEKPLALTEKDGEALIARAARNRLGLQVGLEFRHAPVLTRAAAELEAGKIGRRILSRVGFFRNKKDGVLRTPERYTQLGGVFQELLCHYLDILTWLAGGAPAAVSCQAGKALGTEVWDHGTVEIEHEGGALGVLEFSLLTDRSCESLQIDVLGDQGRMEVRLDSGEIAVTTSAGRDVSRVPDPGHPSQPYPGSYEQIRAFVEGVRESRPLQPGAGVWMRVAAIADAARSSAENHTRVLLPPVA
jgi:predicted dehydrogenase